jgi:hypothetical protein
MKTKIFVTVVGLFLFLPIIQGAAAAVSAPLAVDVSLELTQALKLKEAESLRENLGLFRVRYSSLIDRQNALEKLLSQFRSWFEVVTADGWEPGYEIILEDINAHPDSAEKAEQLRTFAGLVAILREGEVSPAVLAQITPLLDRRKRAAAEAKIELVRTKTEALTAATAIVVVLTTQVNEAFDLDVARLLSLGFFEEHPLFSVGAVAAAAAEGGGGCAAAAATGVREADDLRSIVDLVNEWLDLQTQTKREEVTYLESNLGLLKTKFARLKTSKDEVITQLETLLAKESSVEEKDEVRKQVEALQGLRTSIAEMMEGTKDLFDREFYRLLGLNPDAAVWTLDD